MQRATGNGASIQSDGRNDDHHSIVSELASLIEHVQASIELLEAALARESALGNQEASTNVVILDDVTPRYVKANAALNACSAGLGIALHLLLDNKTSGHGTGELAGSDHRPVRLTGRA